ncbi:hypothetical protein PR202_gb23351 [Eleusine coracana subsp. coracana]|uniref:Uncharacterized protein n=1 Tax=Eleusine coracana subsp. coracana TaxID=191504 RepID=A0AAV5FI79_ELECO|nr:hypothetical protein PR202_gb23351 [Eleusine coracana subsp. coracana]
MLMVLLFIVQVAQVRVAASESSVQIAYLSLNDRIELDIKYADELGYIFSEALGVAPVKVETNYPDVVSILTPKVGNGTYGTHERFVIQVYHGTHMFCLIRERKRSRDCTYKAACKPYPQENGFHNVSILLEQPVNLYCMVSVGAQMYPRDVVLHSGHHLNFTIIGDRTDIRGSGHWLSSNENIVHVNRITGEAHARGEGVAEVIFKGSNVKLQTTVTVLKVNQIVIDAPSGTLTNAAGPPDGYKFSVRFRFDLLHASSTISGLGIYALLLDNSLMSLPFLSVLLVIRDSEHSAGSSLTVPFDCKVEPSFIGFVKPWCDHAAKKSYCIFHPYSPAQLLPANLNSKEGFLHILVRANLKEDPKVTGSAHALFVKGFYIKEPPMLNLTRSSNHSVITVGGNTDVELFWSAKDLLSVHRVDTNEYKGLPSQIVYQVIALKDQPFFDKVTIVLPATGQTEEVEISYDTGGKAEPLSSWITTLAVILTCIVVPVVTVWLFMKLLEKPTKRAPSRHAAPTTPTSAGRPAAMADPASPANGQLSPRTPQPFMEYVRRTIDDTPYYKRDARRRFNPQNTY